MNNRSKLVAAKLVHAIARLIIWFGNKCERISSKIYRIGWKMEDKSFMMDTRVHKPYSLEDKIKDDIIAVQVKKGGCEVQTGNFRRVDCSDNLERSKKHAKQKHVQAVKNTNEVLDIMNKRELQVDDMLRIAKQELV